MSNKKSNEGLTKAEALELLSYLVGNQNRKIQDARYRELAAKYDETNTED